MQSQINDREREQCSRNKRPTYTMTSVSGLGEISDYWQKAWTQEEKNGQPDNSCHFGKCE